MQIEDFVTLIDNVDTITKNSVGLVKAINHILKNTDEFDINQTDAKGNKTTRPSCKNCRKGIDGVHLLPSQRARMDRIKPPKNTIFICPPICDKRTIVGITVKLVRDHDHETGCGREWICDSCNTGLGRFKDNVDFLQKVIDYLNKFVLNKFV